MDLATNFHLDIFPSPRSVRKVEYRAIGRKDRKKVLKALKSANDCVIVLSHFESLVLSPLCPSLASSATTLWLSSWPEALTAIEGEARGVLTHGAN